jgi:hypothetical protein
MASTQTGGSATDMDLMLKRVTSQVLFVDCQQGRAVVDGALVDSGGPDVPVGTPVTLVLRMPPSETVTAVVVETISRWADTGRVVQIELQPRGGAHRATLSDGQATLRLEVEAAA